ncbi:MAG: cytidine deaminase [Anaerolineales bacterium]|nr:cytidine deaminase [Anaerolineales bacterium]
MVTDKQKDALIAAARAVQKKAYAPYSHYLVGAALLGDDGVVYTGVNIENASYGLTVCAERTAVFNMVNAGTKTFQAIAVCGEGKSSPCGACRQVLVEFAGDVPVYLTSSQGEVLETTLHTLLPHHFGPSNLAKGQGTLD